MFDTNNQETPENKQVENQQSSQPSSDSSPFDTILAEIKNPNGEQKYRSVSDGLSALKHSQEHIATLTRDRQQLQAEIDSLRNQVSEIETLKETIAKLTQRGADSEPQGAQLDEETIAKYVEAQIDRRSAKEQAITNQRSVVSALAGVYGETAAKVFYEKASQFGLDPSDAEALAARSPKAVLAWFNISGDGASKQPNKSPTPGKVNTENLQGKPSSFIGAETERVPLGGGEREYNRILENSKNMVAELQESGMSIYDLRDPVQYMKHFNNKG